MYELVPRWRWWLVPPEWFRTLLAFGPAESIRIWSDPEHPFRKRSLINECPEARAIYRQWWEALRQSQRTRYFWGLPKAKWRSEARIIRPPEFHPEIARAKREQEAIKEWSRLHPDRDPIECPIYLGKLASVVDRHANGPSE